MRLQRFAVTSEVMGAMLKTSPEGYWFRVLEGVPPTAEFLHSYISSSGRFIWLVFADDSFPDTPQGGILPVGGINFESRGPSLVSAS